MAHVAVADETLHEWELFEIEHFVAAFSLNAEVNDSVYAIFADRDDRLRLEETISRIVRAPHNTLQLAVRHGLQVACVDGRIDPREEAVLLKLVHFEAFSPDDYSLLREETLVAYSGHHRPGWRNRLTRIIERLRWPQRWTPPELPRHLRSYAQRSIDAARIGDLALVQAVRERNRLTDCDLRYTARVLLAHRRDLLALNVTLEAQDRALPETDAEWLRQGLEMAGSSAATTPPPTPVDTDLRTRLTASRAAIDTLAVELGRAFQRLRARSQTSDSFNLAFLGRSKAGKSTLHSVLTGADKQFIGNGELRVTRYNRVYPRVGARIIDTPGVVAKHGEADERIALDILAEADLVCFLVTGEPQPEEAKFFVDHIQSRAHTALGLVNVKRGISDPQKLATYLRDPEAWYTSQGPNSVWAVIQQFQALLRQEGGQDLRHVYPVQLLAAKLAGDERYKKSAEVLYSSSHLDDLRVALHRLCIEEGSLQRLRTTYTEAALALQRALDEVAKLATAYAELDGQRAKQHYTLKKQSERNYANREQQLRTVIKEKLRPLRDGITNFAYNNYSEASEQFQRNFESYIGHLQVETGITLAVQDVLKLYQAELEEDVKEFVASMLAFERRQARQWNFPSRSGLNWHQINKYVSTIATVGILVATIFNAPLVVYGFGIVGKISSFVEQHTRKHSRQAPAAVVKLTQYLNGDVDEREQAFLSKALAALRELHTQAGHSADKYFDSLEQHIYPIGFALTDCEAALKASIKELHKTLAWRAIELAQGSAHAAVAIDQERVLTEIVDAQREPGKCFAITLRKLPSGVSAAQLSALLQEQVTFQLAPRAKV